MKKYFVYGIALILMFAVFITMFREYSKESPQKIYQDKYPLFDNEIVKADIAGKDADTLYAESYMSTEIEGIALDNVKYVQANSERIIALKQDGTVWCKGTCYCRGDYLYRIYRDWEKVLDNGKYIMLGSSTFMIITEDDELYMWGDNTLGQFGDGSLLEDTATGFHPGTIFYENPVKVADNIKMVWPIRPCLKDAAGSPRPITEDIIVSSKLRTWFLTKTDELLVCGEDVGYDSKFFSYFGELGPNANENIVCTFQLHYVDYQ